MNNKLLPILVAGFLLGIFFASFINTSVYLYLFILLLSTSFLALGILLEKEKAQIYILGAFLIFSFSLGILRFDISRNNLQSALPLNKTSFFEGIISEEPDYRENTTLLTISLSKVGETDIDEKTLVFTDADVAYKYGERLSLFGTLEKPENFETDTGRIFDYENYLEKEGINYILIKPHIDILGEREGNKIKQILFDTKNIFVEKYEKVINEPESSLLGGLLLGLKQGLGKEWSQILRNAGVIHIVVLSGYNITIVAQFLMRLFGFLRLRYRLSLGIISIIAFAIMTGGSATVVRASLMALLVLLAQFIRRKYDVTRALILAGVLMVLQNPQILVFDLSFQLSFLATVGLIYVSPIIEKYFKFIGERFGFKEIIVATIATQIFVLPFLLYSIGNFSTVSLIVNILVLPIIPFAMFFSFLAGIFGFVFTPISILFGSVTYYLLHYALSVSKFFGNLPFASYVVPQFSPVLMFIAYAILIFGIFFWYKRNSATRA
ncbi:MAG: ComEC/Rec2 family competence protein [Patescibacteria group bacterium]